jgi:hypothetical protein
MQPVDCREIYSYPLLLELLKERLQIIPEIHGSCHAEQKNLYLFIYIYQFVYIFIYILIYL